MYRKVYNFVNKRYQTFSVFLLKLIHKLDYKQEKISNRSKHKYRYLSFISFIIFFIKTASLQIIKSHQHYSSSSSSSSSHSRIFKLTNLFLCLNNTNFSSS